jgi:hypothetical protein
MTEEALEIKIASKRHVLLDSLLNSRTSYSVEAWKGFDKALTGKEGWKGFYHLTFMAIKMTRAVMNSDTKELERILDELEKLAQLVNKTTWDEVTDAWELMHNSYQKLEGECARNILEQVFLDQEVREKVGAALQLHDIAQPDEPPVGVLVMLKDAKALLKKNMNDFVKAANKELAKMQRIRDHQVRLVGWMSFVIVTIGTFLGNIISQGIPLVVTERTYRDYRPTAAMIREANSNSEGLLLSFCSFVLILILLLVKLRRAKTRDQFARTLRLGVKALLGIPIVVLVFWLALHSFGYELIAPRGEQPVLVLHETGHHGYVRL